MREIKFRAWDVESKSMAFVETLHLGEKIKPQIKNCKWDWYKRDYKLMQYTGLKDVNGVEIYEGDILYALDNNEEYEEYVGVVEYDSVGCFVTTGFPHVTSDDCFVKGNIYENPELK